MRSLRDCAMQIKTIILLTVALVIGGCSSVSPHRTYPGEPLPPEKVSWLVSGTRDFFIASVTARILSVDGTTFDHTKSLVETLPGKHSVAVRLSLCGLSGCTYGYGKPQCITITTKAGHMYRFYGYFRENKIWFEEQQIPTRSVQ